MGRNRVLSFMSQFSASNRDSISYPADDPQYPNKSDSNEPVNPAQAPFALNTSTPVPSSPARRDFEDSPSSLPNSNRSSPTGRNRSNSRPLSMVQAYQPPIMDLNQDTIPELLPIFTFLNSHANKLYQEGYFLKLDDQNSQGRPNADRTWTECFAQLVGTVLSLWDAAELDAAGEDGEVLPKFINLTDASIKMIESLPTRTNDETPLQNILSISTAGRNRYLLHFNSHHSLIQWTAGIRLAMYEHSTLQEAYTGALIAGKGKKLNNINLIMERSKFKIEDWVRVRFGAGVPWRRCWCVISPPDEKEYQKLQKDLKKRSPYDRSHVPVLKGDIKFYDTKIQGKKQKKAKPIASITDAYSAYAIYPQAKSLIDASTLIKIEGNITIHSEPPSSTEGFVFIMPEVPPAVSGFEMMLRFIFPTWDTFGLYGRPGRLVASVLDPRSLMFAMPKHKRYGYLEILDVSGLILESGSSTWSEREWRKRLKELTGKRMNAVEDAPSHKRSDSRKSARLSFGGSPAASKPRVGFADQGSSTRSSRSMSLTQPAGTRTDSAPPAADRQRAPPAMANASQRGHARNASDTNLQGPPPIQTQMPFDAQQQPPYGAQQTPYGMTQSPYSMTQSPYSMQQSPYSTYQSPQGPAGRNFSSDLAATPERVSSEDERPGRGTPPRDLENMRTLDTPEPVQAPPAFAHRAASRPAGRPYHSPELRRANSRLSSTTLAQLAKAGGVPIPAEHEFYSDSQGNEGGGYYGQDPRGPPVHPIANSGGMNANSNRSPQVLKASPHVTRQSSGLAPPAMTTDSKRSKSPLAQPPSDYSSYQGSQNLTYQEPSLPSPPPAPRIESRPALSSTPHSSSQLQLQAPTASNQPNTPEGRPKTPPQPAQQRTLPLHVQTSPPIHRKPLPQRTTSLRQQEPPPSPQSSTSAGSLHIDPAILEQVQQFDPSREHTPLPERQIYRQNTQVSGVSSHYGDTVTSRSSSPDYASTRKSSETAASVERPRAGVLKTVGTSDAPPVPKHDPAYDIPSIDFGPTYNLNARSKTPTPLGSPPAVTDSRTKSPHRKSPGAEYTHNRDELDDSHRRSVVDNSHRRSVIDDNNRRSIAWQPAATIPTGTNNPQHGLSPEQYVQQRAAASPMYAHQRSPSGNVLANSRPGTATPPFNRSASQERLGMHHRRGSSGDLLSRPNSRGANSALGFHTPTGSGDISSYLSAREQEHLARATGSPLISMAGNKNAQSPDQGLVGHIGLREREKQQVRQGISTQAVQYAINQRQQQQAQMQPHMQPQMQPHPQQFQQLSQQQFQQQPYPNQIGLYGSGAPSMLNANMSTSNLSQMGGPAPSMYSMGMGPVMPMGRSVSGFGQSSPPFTRYGPPQNWASPATQAYAQGGGFSRPGMHQRNRSDSPGMRGIASPPVQYSPGGRQTPTNGRQTPMDDRGHYQYQDQTLYAQRQFQHSPGSAM